MSICAGVQNVSRPTLSCQEMSQTPPMTLEETAMTLHQMYQGMESDLAETRSAVRTWSVEESGIVPAIWICPEKIVARGISAPNIRVHPIYTVQFTLAGRFQE